MSFMKCKYSMGLKVQENSASITLKWGLKATELNSFN